jgi:ubiquinone/menaquinone biosynthesis C-methylase UbiE
VATARVRRADPRIAAQIDAALGDARTVLNVGAGTGSYEPEERELTAVEPSAEMIGQRPAGLAPAVQASAEDLPFPDESFDAAMAVLTAHHWADLDAGLAEMRRVTRERIVIVAFDPEALGAAARRLAADLESGAWDERHGHLRERRELDVGLCLVLAESNRQESKG